MAAVPERLAQEPGHQRIEPGVRQAVAEVVGCVVLADRGEVAEWTLARCDDC